MKSLLKATPFTVFMSLVVFPVAILITWFLIAVFSFFDAFSHSSLDKSGNSLEIIAATGAVLISLYVICLMGWLYTLGTNLSPLASEDMRTDRRLFRICITAPVAYTLLSVCLIFFFMNGDFIKIMSAVLFIFGLLRYLLLISVIYCAFVISRMLKSVEAGRSVHFEEFAGEFFLMVIFPVGIWFLQPRIKKLFDDHPAAAALKLPDIPA